MGYASTSGFVRRSLNFFLTFLNLIETLSQLVVMCGRSPATETETEKPAFSENVKNAFGASPLVPNFVRVSNMGTNIEQKLI